MNSAPSGYTDRVTISEALQTVVCDDQAGGVAWTADGRSWRVWLPQVMSPDRVDSLIQRWELLDGRTNTDLQTLAPTSLLLDFGVTTVVSRTGQVLYS